MDVWLLYSSISSCFTMDSFYLHCFLSRLIVIKISIMMLSLYFIQQLLIPLVSQPTFSLFLCNGQGWVKGSFNLPRRVDGK